MEPWELAEAEDYVENKIMLGNELDRLGVGNDIWKIDNDIVVHGKLSVLLEFCQDWRSEIEELG